MLESKARKKLYMSMSFIALQATKLPSRALCFDAAMPPALCRHEVKVS